MRADPDIDETVSWVRSGIPEERWPDDVRKEHERRRSTLQAWEARPENQAKIAAWHKEWDEADAYGEEAWRNRQQRPRMVCNCDDLGCPECYPARNDRCSWGCCRGSVCQNVRDGESGC